MLQYIRIDPIAKISVKSIDTRCEEEIYIS